MAAVSDPRSIAWFNAASPDTATAAVAPICASSRWIAALLAGRPYASLAAANAASNAALDALDWADVEQALSAHPRIGERARGDTTEARWSREEQSRAATDADSVGTAGTAEQLRRGNVEYEQQFGFVFLICATGRDADEMLSRLRDRLGNTVEVEREVVRDELKQIVALRLARSFR